MTARLPLCLSLFCRPPSFVPILTSGSKSLHCDEDALPHIKCGGAGGVVLIPSTEAVLSEAEVFRSGAVGLISRTEALAYNGHVSRRGVFS